jgi:peptidoglycan/LPS O-acetylase OafA/YrhL
MSTSGPHARDLRVWSCRVSDQPTAKYEYFHALDSLRGIAALQVVIFHLPAWFAPLYHAELVRSGWVMVNFFFVLSGFVLCHSYADRLETRRDLSKFFVLRVGRIYPVHLLFLLLFLGFELVKYAGAAQGVAGGAFTDNSPRALLECLLLVQALGFSNNANAFNFPSWSISTEFYTYVVFAILAVAFARVRFRLVSALLAVVTLASLVFLKPELGTAHLWMRCLTGFFVGCVTCYLYRALRGHQVSSLWSVVAAAALLAFLSVHLRLEEAFTELVYPISACLVLALSLAPQSPVNTFLGWRPLRWLGEVSYSVYMCHAFVLAIARRAVRALKFPEVMVDGVATPQLPPVLGALLCLGSVVAALVVAGLTYRYVENPGRIKARQWVSASARPAPVVAKA